MPDNPVLYFRTRTTASTIYNLDSLISNRASQCIVFEKGTKTQIEAISSTGDDNTIIEPEISASGTKTLNKQIVGALPESITISGNIDISENIILQKLRTFYRKPQIEIEHHEYGIIGFFSNGVSYFDVDPTNTIGYSMKPPSITWLSPQKQISFSIELQLGGRNLT